MTRLCAFSFLLFSALPCAAHEGADGKGDWPCQADSERLCGGVKPGGGRLAACLKEHLDEVSPECRDSWEQKKKNIKQGMEEGAQACKDDKVKFCGDAEAGGGGIMKCMMEHKDELSDKCRAFMAKKKAQMKDGGKMAAMQAACRDDKEKLCGDAEAGGGGIIQCMMEHKDELSEKCRGAMTQKARDWQKNRRMKGSEDKPMPDSEPGE
ncbi:MAG: hypothetical protein HY077_08480 [Elusimicrobia bacterium]|nr:hypothetical protein [Elusimicrobiota bacterium]